MTVVRDNRTAAIRSKSASLKLRDVLLATTCLVPLLITYDVAQAQVVIEGGATENVPGTQASPWNIGNVLTVGDNTDGTLNVGVGGVAGSVTATEVNVGYSSTSAAGRITVTGAGSSFSNSANLFVGYNGQGFLTVQGGATVDSATLGGTLAISYIGYANNSIGTVYVLGAGSVWTTNSLEVGASDGSEGYLTVSNGGRVNTTDATIGDLTATQGAGSVFVTGVGSTWNLTSDLTVGNFGTGSLNVDSGGTVSVAGDGYIGRWVGGNGIVSVAGAGSSLNVAGTLTVGVNNSAGNLTIADSGVVSVGGGAGTLVIAGPNANGIVSIGGAFGQSAAAAGELQASLVQFGAGGSGILNFNHTDSNYIFAPVIAGVGQIIQQAGHTTLSANSNAFTDAIIVNGGTLSINGSFTGTTGVTVNGGTLGGTGTVTDTMINSGGTLAPGNSIGTFNVFGALTFNAGSVYSIEVSPTASDHTHVFGEATLGGVTVAASFAPGSYINKQYNILHADLGVTGTFGALNNTNLPANFVSSLSYDADNVYLNLAAAFAGSSTNQQNVAGALNNYFNATGSIPAVFGSLNANGFTQVSGEVGAAVAPAGFMAMNQFISAMSDASAGVKVAPGASNASAYAPEQKLSRQQASAYAAVTPRDRIAPAFAERWNVWASGYGSNSSVDGDGPVGSHNTSTRVYGTVVGGDYRSGPDTHLGFALGGAGTTFTLDSALGGGRADLFQAGGYARHQIGAAYFAGSVGYSWQDVTTDRTVHAFDLAGLPTSAALRGRVEAHTFAARGESGWRVTLPLANVTPYAAFQVSSTRVPGYNETAVSGSNDFALTYAAQSPTNVRTELGLRADQTWAMAEGDITLRGRAAWMHDSNASPNATPSFQALPGSSFTVYGAAQSPDALLTTASVEAKWLNGFSVGATLENEFSKTSNSLAGRGTLRYSW